jgi:hypothetical protein
VARGRGNRPPPIVTAEREEKIAELSARGWSSRKIAAEVGISHVSVCRALDRIYAREARSFSRRWPGLRQKMLQRLDHIIEEESHAWEKSKEPGHRVTTNADGEQIEQVFVREGNYVYHITVMKAMEHQARIAGLNIAEQDTDAARGIAEVAADIKAKGDGYETRTAEGRGAGDPEGAPPADPGGDPQVPG